MTQKWTVRRATPEDAEGIRSLFRHIHGTVQTEAYERWRFETNSETPKIAMVADIAGQIVGQYALWVTPLRVGQETILGAQSFDTMTHPDYRGQGMFTVLAEACMAQAAQMGVEMLFGFPNENSYPGFVGRLNWKHVVDIRLWMRPLNPSKHRHLPNVLGPVADLAARLLPQGRIKSYDIENRAPSDEDLESLLAHWRTKDDVCRVDRTLSRLRWRFSPEAGRDYRWAAIRSTSDESQAVSVWGSDPTGSNALLCEVIGLNGGARVAAVGAATRQALEADKSFMLACTNDQEIIPALWKCGFFPYGKIPLITRALTTRARPANTQDYPWRIQGSDLDTY